MSNEFDNIFSYKPDNAKSAEELYEKRITDDTIFDGIRSCQKCGRELSNDEFTCKCFKRRHSVPSQNSC